MTLAGGAAAGWPLTARAQSTVTSLIGFLNSQSADGYPAEGLQTFDRGLKDGGYVGG
jgi:hypothetical protein